MTPRSKKVKTAVFSKLDKLKNRRDKKSLASRRLLLDTISSGNEQPGCKPLVTSPYKRTAANIKTATAVAFLEDISVDLPGKKTVNKRTLTQKKVLPKRLKRLHRDFRSHYPEVMVSLRTMYRHLPRHIKTMKHQSYRQCLCETCTNVDLLLDALQPFLQTSIDGRDVISDISLCSTPSLACYNRKCTACGVKLVLQHIANNLTVVDPSTQEVKWQTWTLVKKDKGQRREKVTIRRSLHDLIKKLEQDVDPLCLFHCLTSS